VHYYGSPLMSYQAKQRRCARCKKRSTHWRDLPDLPSNWIRRIGYLPEYVWCWLATDWNCRGCLGVPKGPLGASSSRRWRPY
jgi:hypothetical protein